VKQPTLWWYRGIPVREHTRSEARARLKQLLRLKRLPPGAAVERDGESIAFDVAAGDRGTVYLDGQQVRYAICGETGRRGWVEAFIEDVDGKLITRGGRLLREVLRGDVSVDLERRCVPPAPFHGPLGYLVQIRPFVTLPRLPFAGFTG